MILDRKIIIDGEICFDDIKTPKQADELWAKISEEKLQIEAQLEYANAFFIKNGYHEDPDWAARAKSALSFKKRSLNLIQTAKAKIGREARAAKQTDHTARQERLIEALRMEIGEDRFQEIVRIIE